MDPSIHFKDVPDTEFNRKYPPDAWGEEFSDNARFWKVYRDVRTEADKCMLEGWHKTLDVLLIFAGLFSAVSTAFIIESYKSLQPDYAQYMATFMYAAALAYNSSGSQLPPLDKIFAPDIVQQSTSSRWVNGLWFSSLVVSLSVALLCILSKQWLDEYDAHIVSSAQSFRYWAHRHVFYRNGLFSWGVPTLISGLPLLLHFSLFLFLVGLVIFLHPLDPAIAYVVLGMALLAFNFYAAALVLPLWRLDCPSYTPLLPRLSSAWLKTLSLVSATCSIIGEVVSALVTGGGSHRQPTTWRRMLLSISRVMWRLSRRTAQGHSESRESDTLAKRSKILDGDALLQFLKSTHDQDLSLVAVEAIGAITSTTTMGMLPLNDTFSSDGALFGVPLRDAWEENSWSRVSFSRYARSWLSASKFPWRRATLIYQPLLGMQPSGDLGHEDLLLSVLVQFYRNDSKPAYLQPLLELFETEHEHVMNSIIELSDSLLSPPTVLHRSSCLQGLLAMDQVSSFSPALAIHLFHAGLFFAADNDTLVAVAQRFRNALKQRGLLSQWSFLPESFEEQRRHAKEARAQCFDLLCCMLTNRLALSIDDGCSALLLHDLGLFAKELMPAIPNPPDLRYDLPEFVKLVTQLQTPCEWQTLNNFVQLLPHVRYGAGTDVSLSQLGTCYAILLKAMPSYTGRQRSWIDMGDRLFQLLDAFRDPTTHEAVFMPFIEGPSSIATWAGIRVDRSTADGARMKHFGNFSAHVAILAKVLAKARRSRQGGGTNPPLAPADETVTIVRAFFCSQYARDVLRYTLRGVQQLQRSTTAQHIRDIAKHCMKVSPAVWDELCGMLVKDEEYEDDLREGGLREFVVQAVVMLSKEFARDGKPYVDCDDRCECMALDQPASRSSWMYRFRARIPKEAPGKIAEV